LSDMDESELGENADREMQSADQRPRGLGGAWLGAWAGMLALAVWLSQLTLPWLAITASGAALWTASILRRPNPSAFTATLLLWLAVGLAAGVQYRLEEIATSWERLQERIEDRAADALGASLDELVSQGERAVDGAAEAARLHRDHGATPELFERLDALQRRSGVAAIALFDADGSAIAWAGEHRGSIPAVARLGSYSYFFDQGPLFSYLYFIRPLPGGVTATAAFLLDANLAVSEGDEPFASFFERRHGTRPRFWHPERARAEAVWDWATDRPILSVSFAALTQQQWWERIVRNGRRAVGILALGALLLLSIAWYRARMPGSGVPVLVVTSVLLIAPLGRITDDEVLFSPLQFVLPGPLDVTLGVVLILLLGGSVWLLTRLEREPRRWLPIWVSVPLAALIFPAAILLIERSSAEGLLASRAGGGFSLQLASTLLIAFPLYLLLRYSRAPVGRWLPGGLTKALGFGAPAAFGLLVLLWWRPEFDVPIVFAAAWVLPTLLLLNRLPRSRLLRGSLGTWLLAAWLGGTASLAFLWPLHVRAELARAERELALLGTPADPFLDFLLRQFAEQAIIHAEEGEQGVNLLYRSWVSSGLAREGYEARMAFWRGAEPITELNLSERGTPPEAYAQIVDGADGPLVRHFGGVDGLHYLLIAPVDEGRAISVAVPPRRRLTGATPLARLLHPEQSVDLGYRGESLHLVPVDPESPMVDHAGLPADHDTVHWMRVDRGWRSEAMVEMPEGAVHAHLEVSHPVLPLLLTRAILLLAALLLIFSALWLVARAICRELSTVPLLRGEWLRSFRGRLSVALFFFFLLPTIVFGAVSYGAVAREVVRSAAALAQQALDQAALSLQRASLTEVGSFVGADLLLYHGGALVNATPQEIIELGLFHTWLSPSTYLRFAAGEDLQGLEERRLAESDYLVAYRRLDTRNVIAAPIPLASQEISRRQKEFRDVALLMILIGLGLSVVLALLVSRALASPLDQLSRAAATVGSGDFRTRLPQTRSDEFGSVYASFNQMIQRLRQTRVALVQETRRTETIVAEAATGVLALDREGRVELINPRAAEILGESLQTGVDLLRGDQAGGALAAAIHALWRSPSVEPATELELDGRVVRMKLRRLSGEDGGGGAVVALEDVTAEVRTARVLAWGEMARQVAHEIKNPLTPIKLAVQHLRRAYLDQRPDFGEILDRNVEAILSEIDRLGEIARAFSRFGTPLETDSPLEAVDVARAVRETLALYRGTGGDVTFRFEAEDDSLPLVVARSGELKEVLLNLLENAREAISHGGEVRVFASVPADRPGVRLIVEDTGVGIPEDQVSRIFEPHFSTRSSGTGLGLAIVRRIIDSWGGEIRVHSVPGEGARFEIYLRAAGGAG